jgi:hypothetical protein
VRRTAIYFDAQGEPAAIQLGQLTDRARRQLTAALGEEPRYEFGLVMLTVEQAITVARWAGPLSRTDSPDYEVTSDLFHCLESGFFNPFWEDGLNSAERGEESFQ